VILQVSENTVKFHGGQIRPLAAATQRPLRPRPTPPVGLHLDHAESGGPCGMGAAAKPATHPSWSTAGHYPTARNVTITRRRHENCFTSKDFSVEAELGYVGGKDTQVASARTRRGVRTDPQTGPPRFVAATGGRRARPSRVGSLARHDDADGRARPSISFARATRRGGRLPLVLHGSSGRARTTRWRAAVPGGAS